MAGLLDGVLPYLYSRSDALKRQIGGLLSDPMGTLAQTAGLLSDNANTQQGLMGQAFANPKRPFQVTDQDAMMQAAQAMLNGPLGIAPAGITVYHGSPHTFDRFDASKIGTGEGAQAYGHGLYLAENPQTAEFYKGALTDRFPAKLDGKAMQELTTAQKSALGILNDYGGNVDSALSFAKRDMAKAGSAGADFHAERYNTLLDIKKGHKAAEVASPSLYKVDLPDSAVAKMLDWDAALSNQPAAVRDALKNAGIADGSGFSGGLSGRELYNRARNGAPAKLPLRQVDDEIFAADRLRQAGIPGIRYLDGGSRGAGQGSSNFVIFPGNESLLQILERNGQPLR
jgi:hypothetical protein